MDLSPNGGTTREPRSSPTGAASPDRSGGGSTSREDGRPARRPRRWGLGSKLLGAFCSILVSFLVAQVVVERGIEAVHRESRSLRDWVLPSMVESLGLVEALERTVSGTRDLGNVGTDVESADSARRVLEDVEVAAAHLEALARGAEPERVASLRAHLAALKGAVVAVTDSTLEDLDGSEEFVTPEARVVEAARRLREDVASLVRERERSSARTASDGVTRVDRARAFGRAAFLLVAVLAVAVVVVYVRGDVVRRIERLSDALRRLSAGDLDQPVEVEGSDELADLARAAEVFREHALENQRLNERLQEQNDELQQLAYVASHDLKSPLRAVETLASFVEEDCGDVLPEESRGHLSLLRARARKMESLLEDLLRFSRLGRCDELAELVDPRRLVAECVQLLDVPAGFDVVVEGDPGWLRVLRTPLELVCRNLIGNALQHHDRAVGRVTVSLGVDASPGAGTLVLDVVDDGPGIPPESREEAFTMFRSLRVATAGTGMGLALVRKAARVAGGSVELVERAGRGAHLRVRWPIVDEQRAALAPTLLTGPTSEAG